MPTKRSFLALLLTTACGSDSVALPEFPFETDTDDASSTGFDASTTTFDSSSSSSTSSTSSTSGPPTSGSAGSSGGEDGLPSQVTWEELWEQARAVAQQEEPTAELNFVFARGLRPDGTVDLADIASDPAVTFTFSDVSLDAGVDVRFTAASYDPLAAEYEPSVTLVSGNFWVFTSLSDVSEVPSFSQVANAVAATQGCTSFGGTEQDMITVRLVPLLETFVEVSVATATGSTSANATDLTFSPCTD